MWFFYAVMIFLAGLAMFIMTEEIWKNYKEEKENPAVLSRDRRE